MKKQLAGLGQEHHFFAACTVIAGMLYMFMDLFEIWRDPYGDASSSFFPGELQD